MRGEISLVRTLRLIQYEIFFLFNCFSTLSGTRHSRVTALSKDFTKDEIKEFGTGHDTSRALERYFQAEANQSQSIYEVAAGTKKEKGLCKNNTDSKVRKLQTFLKPFSVHLIFVTD